METKPMKAAFDGDPLRRMLAVAISQAETNVGIGLETPVVGVMLVVMLPDRHSKSEEDMLHNDTMLVGMSMIEDEEFCARAFTAMVGDCLDHGLNPEELLARSREVLDQSRDLRACEGN